MKLPFDFGVKLFFRLLLPGFLLALGLSPILFTLWDWIGQIFNPYLIKDEIAFIIVAILLGWVVTICDMQIYMIFEGRRFWPKTLKRFFLKKEQKRIDRILGRIRKYDSTSNEYIEAYADLRTFPIDESGNYKVIYPSRLGNLIMSYENYPDSRYGMDGIFYWNRIWLKLDKDTREYLDSSQAMADSTLYVSFTLFINGLIWIGYALASVFGVLPTKYFPSMPALWSLSCIWFLFAYGIYRLSLHTHGQFGELIKSMFDNYKSKVDQDISEVLDEIMTVVDDPSLGMRPRREKRDIVRRYLNYYLILCPECGERLSPPAAKAHNCKAVQP
jgi:hypothetical protein